VIVWLAAVTIIRQMIKLPVVGTVNPALAVHEPLAYDVANEVTPVVLLVVMPDWKAATLTLMMAPRR
jgi:hypothetical protein